VPRKWYKPTDISVEDTASIFRAESKQAASGVLEHITPKSRWNFTRIYDGISRKILVTIVIDARTYFQHIRTTLLQISLATRDFSSVMLATCRMLGVSTANRSLCLALHADMFRTGAEQRSEWEVRNCISTSGIKTERTRGDGAGAGLTFP
jgi:hypothetical protein